MDTDFHDSQDPRDGYALTHLFTCSTAILTTQSPVTNP
jgi:hypothetical protein